MYQSKMIEGGDFTRKLKIICLAIAVMAALQGTAAAVPITSGFGWRVHPITGEWKFHAGVDFGYEYGTPIGAVFPGTVIFAEAYGGYGNTVIVDHGNSKYTLYGHCSTLYVKAGDWVDESTAIAAVGSTGNSTGPHLHLELWENGEYKNPLTIWE